MHARSGKLILRQWIRDFFIHICEEYFKKHTRIYDTFFCTAALFSESLALTFSSYHSNKATKTTSTLRAEYMR